MANYKIAVIFAIIALFALATAMPFPEPEPEPGYLGPRHEHYVFHVPYHIHTVHHHTYHKIPVYKKYHGWY